jgi:D-sedoheptulose 7-phosphate isomerase
MKKSEMNEIVSIIKKAKMVYVIGNGGSASIADHLVNDLVKKCHIRAISLCSNLALLTAYANDNGYENIFVDQLKVFLDPKDVLIALSTSGKSINIVKAIEYADSIGASIIIFPNGEVISTENLYVKLAHKIVKKLC